MAGNDYSAPALIDIQQSCYVRSFTYPGKRPDFPFLSDGVYLHRLNTESGIDHSQWLFADSNRGVNQYLQQRQETPAGRRYPIVAYGANRNPHNLAWKLKRANISGSIIGLPVRIKDADVVAANMFHSGHMYADLIWDRVETRDVHVDAVVLLLDHEQFKMINATERVPSLQELESGEDFRGMRVSLFQNIALEGHSRHIFSLGYVSWANTWAPHGQPIAFRNIRSVNRRLPEMTQMEMFELVQQRYRQNLSVAEMIARMEKHWKHVRETRINGYDVDWFRCLIDEINGDGLIDEDGHQRSGIRDAKLRDSLLSPRDTWHPGPQYTVSQWQHA